MRFKVTYHLPIPISIIVDEVADQRQAVEEANLDNDVRFALACFIVDQEKKADSPYNDVTVTAERMDEEDDAVQSDV